MMRVVRKGVVTAALAASCLFLNTPVAHALQQTLTLFTASGQIVSQEACSPTEVCQIALISGKAAQLGAFTGILSERVDLESGTYTGTGTFTFSGGTINTAYRGQVVPTLSGGAVFSEQHQIIGGTGQFAAATGQLLDTGVADAAGKLSVVGVGLVTW